MAPFSLARLLLLDAFRAEGQTRIQIRERQPEIEQRDIEDRRQPNQIAANPITMRRTVTDADGRAFLVHQHDIGQRRDRLTFFQPVEEVHSCSGAQ